MDYRPVRQVFQMDFIPLHDLLLPPPLASFLSVMTVLGVWWLAHVVAHTFWLRPKSIEKACGFIFVSGIIASLINTMALLQAIPFWILRSIVGVLACLGVLQLSNLSRKALSVRSTWFRNENFIFRMSAVMVGVILVALLLAALGPATDADSLDYHLGVPLDWLRNGGAYARPDWYHARLVGLGEGLSLLGLAAGTDNLNAVFQYSSLFILWKIVTSQCQDRRSEILVSLLIVGCPILLFLVANQKPQLFPGVCLVISCIILVKTEKITPREIIAIAFLVSCAIASKYSMILGGSIAILVTLIRCFKQDQGKIAIVCFFLCLAFLAGPNWIRNFLFYGDPLSPLLAQFVYDADSPVIDFMQVLRETGGGTSFKRYLGLPLEWMFSPNLIVGTNVFGIGLLGFLAVDLKNSQSRQYLGIALSILILVLALGQITARFAFESFALAGVALAVCEWNKRKRVLFHLLFAQTLLVLVMAIYTAGLLFPGSFSQSHRHALMHKVAHNYSVTQWLDEVVPKNALLLSRIRSNVLLPRRSRSSDEVRYLSRADYFRLIKQLSVTNDHLIFVEYDALYPRYSVLDQCNSRILDGPQSFKHASRNPFTRNKLSFSLIVLEYIKDSEGCLNSEQSRS